MLLCVLIAVAAFVYLKKFRSPAGALTLEVPLTTVDVFIDDRKIEFSAPRLGALTLTVNVQPGTHTVKVTKDKFHPFVREISMKAGATEVVRVDLKRIIKEYTGPYLEDFEGTWVVNYSNKILRVYTVARNGQVMWEQPQQPYVISERGDDFVMDAGSAVERWKLVAGKLRIEHFNPQSRYPKQGSSETAIGERKKAQELAEDAEVLRTFRGKWKILYDNNTQSIFTVNDGGRLLGQQRRLVRIKGHVLLDYGDGRLDRLTREGDQLKVEHYNPCTKYLDDPEHPHVRGRAMRDPTP